MHDDDWEFQVCFRTRNLSDQVRPFVNPFNGKTIEVPLDDGLNRSERDAVLQLLQTYDFQLGDPRGYSTTLQGDVIIVEPGNLAGSDRVESLRISMGVSGELSVELLGFIRQLAVAGNLAFAGKTIGLVSGHDEKSKERWPNAVMIESAEELRNWIVENAARDWS